MLHLLLVSPSSVADAGEDTTTSMPPSSTTSRSAANHSSSSLHFCKHSPSAILDILILILVLFSCTYLLSSYFSYLIHTISLLSSHFQITFSLSSLHSLFFVADQPTEDDYPFAVHLAMFVFGLAFFFTALLTFLNTCSELRSRKRKCRNPKCKGLKKAMEFELQLQSEECVKSGLVKEIEQLPWRGGSESNPAYECLRAELRKMAPPNGRAILIFRTKCGCVIAKLQGWGPKRARRHKKSPEKSAVKGRVDNRQSGNSPN